MMIHRKRKELMPERKHPGDPEPDWCSPGSIEQELDMCETGSLRGDEILHSHGREPRTYTGDPPELDQIINENWEMDLSEEDREGSEMSGDEHSSGLGGSELELEGQPHISTGLPGDRTRREVKEIQAEETLHPEEIEIPITPKKPMSRLKKRAQR